MIAEGHDVLATLNPAWTFEREVDITWRTGERVGVTTLDELIERFGVPAFVKIDTEGLEDKVLVGLSQPVDQLLFEVSCKLPDVAARAFARLADLGGYRCRLAQLDAWRFARRQSPEEILRNLPYWGNVWARQPR